MTDNEAVTDIGSWPLGRLLRQARHADEAPGGTRSPRLISLERAAARAGISTNTLRNLELGYRHRDGQRVPVRPTAELVTRVADALGIDQREALVAAGLEQDWTVVQDHPKDGSHGRLIIATTRVLTDDDLAAIRRILGSVVSGRSES